MKFLLLLLSVLTCDVALAADTWLSRVKTMDGTTSQWPWRLKSDGTWETKQPEFNDLANALTQLPAKTYNWTASQQFNVTGPTVHTEFGGEEAYMGLYYGVTATSNTNPELVALFSLYSAVGYTATPTDHFKSALNAVATADLDSSWLWAFNGACGIKSTVTHPLGCVVNESDYNNNATNMVGLPATAAGPWGVAFAASGGGTKYGHAAYAAIGSVPLFNYGILIADYTAGGSSLIQTADIYSKSKAPYFVQEKGAHQYGLALDGTYSAAAIRLPNNSAFVARNVANTLDLSMFYLSTGDALVLGQGATSVLLGSTMLPVTSGTQGLGDSTHRWASVWTNEININSSGNGPVNVKAASGAPTIGAFQNAGGADASVAWFTLRDGYTGTRGAGSAGDGNGPALAFQSWSRSTGGKIVDSVILNCGLVYADAAAEQSLCDFNGYRSGAISVLVTIDAARPSFLPGTDNVWNLGDVASLGARHSNNRWKDGYFTGSLYVNGGIAAGMGIGGSVSAGVALDAANVGFRLPNNAGYFAFQGNGGAGTRVLFDSALATFYTPVTSTGYVQSGAVAVASLPACNAGTKGARHFVTDANATTFASTVAAGGANNVPVVCNGTNWIIG